MEQAIAALTDLDSEDLSDVRAKKRDDDIEEEEEEEGEVDGELDESDEIEGGKRERS